MTSGFTFPGLREHIPGKTRSCDYHRPLFPFSTYMGYFDMQKIRYPRQEQQPLSRSRETCNCLPGQHTGAAEITPFRPPNSPTSFSQAMPLKVRQMCNKLAAHDPHSWGSTAAGAPGAALAQWLVQFCKHHMNIPEYTTATCQALHGHLPGNAQQQLQCTTAIAVHNRVAVHNSRCSTHTAC
jgi:hypothetical protein